MEITSQQKGKLGELWVFGKLLNAGVNVYLPLVDEEGIDAVIRTSDGRLLGIQVKSTRAKDQAGYFNAYLEPREDLFIACVDLSPLDETPSQPPEVWVFPSKVFANEEYSTRSKKGEYRLALASRSRRHGNKPRKEILRAYREAWEPLKV